MPKQNEERWDGAKKRWERYDEHYGWEGLWSPEDNQVDIDNLERIANRAALVSKMLFDVIQSAKHTNRAVSTEYLIKHYGDKYVWSDVKEVLADAQEYTQLVSKLGGRLGLR